MQCLAELIQESMHQNLLNVRYFKLLLYTLQYQKHINDRSANDGGCLLPNGND